MTNDEIIEQLESLLAHCKSMIEKDGGFPIWEKDCEALEAAISALRPSGEPLTLEQLREMDGKPVRMEDLTGGTLWNQWIIFERHTDDGFIPRGGGYFGCDSYGVKWLAYAYPPIDREKWKAEWVWRSDDDGCTWLQCTACDYSLDSLEDEPKDFCPGCGRAMTPKAWAELEKRLRG